MATRRTKSLSTKVTEAEYELVASLAAPLTISECAQNPAACGAARSHGVRLARRAPGPASHPPESAFRTRRRNCRDRGFDARSDRSGGSRQVEKSGRAPRRHSSQGRIGKSMNRPARPNRRKPTAPLTPAHPPCSSEATAQRLSPALVLLTPVEVAELLRTTRKAIYSMVERSQLPGVVRIGRRVLVRQDALLDWLRQKSTPSLEGRQ